jgi:hypothetical protein
VTTGIAASEELRSSYAAMSKVLRLCEAALEPMLEVADHADELLNAEWPKLATNEEIDIFQELAGYTEMFGTLKRVCDQLGHFIPGSMLPS